MTVPRARSVSFRWISLITGLLSYAGAMTLASWQDLPANPNAAQAPTTAGTSPTADPAAIAEGQAMFRGLCSGCHGGSGRGGKGPDLTDNRWIHGSTDADIARVIENGVPNTTMKKLGDALKPEQIQKLVAYIRSLARSPGESTWKPYMSR